MFLERGAIVALVLGLAGFGGAAWATSELRLQAANVVVPATVMPSAPESQRQVQRARVAAERRRAAALAAAAAARRRARSVRMGSSSSRSYGGGGWSGGK